MLEKLLDLGRKIIPKKLFTFGQPIYHYALALAGVIIYRFPSKKTFVVAVTGTKGKTSTSELINAFLEEAGYKTALASTLRIKIGQKSERNMFKMTIKGRFFVQSFLRRAVSAKCDYVILEITSQAVLQFRHTFLDLNALVFTNLSPEHIESHGSYENYINAKVEIAKAVANSSKPNTLIVSNADDKEGYCFLNVNADQKYSYTLKDIEPVTLYKDGLEFNLNGKMVRSHLRGQFNAYNILAAITFAKTQGVTDEQIASALEKLTTIGGRVENIAAGQDFEVIVDYAHTPDSLTQLYEAFPNRRKIGVLGNTGGGRDKWKRAGMGKIASTYCDEVILTDEDPYDEDPQEIVNQMAEGVDPKKCEIIMDRRKAIYAAITKARTGDVVLITGKGTDPYIMRANNQKERWDDREVAKEELEKFMKEKKS